jgi:hypothetical protein
MVHENVKNFTPHWCCGSQHVRLWAAWLQRRIVVFNDDRIKAGRGYGCDITTPGTGESFRERLLGTAFLEVGARDMEQVLARDHTPGTIYLIYGWASAHYNYVDFRPRAPAGPVSQACDPEPPA